MNKIGRVSLALVVGVFAGLCSGVLAPTQASALTVTFTKISAGSQHTCAISSTGAVYCWGWNAYGQLGNGTTTNSSTPVPVTGITSGATDISAGAGHTCAIVSGSAKCWGLNLWGQLGKEFISPAYVPSQVVGLTANVSSISAGDKHSCAVRASQLLCWGDNFYGQLGSTGISSSELPVVVTGQNSGVVSVSAGTNHTCARILLSDARCWGYNFNGQLGNNTYGSSSVPVTPVGLTSGVTRVTTGDRHSCAIVNSGMQCWGESIGGALGNQFAIGAQPAPIQVTNLTSGVTDISGGYLNTCAVVNGAAKCWGFNGGGAVGDGTTSNRSTPTQVVGLTSGVTSIGIGGTSGSSKTHACAVANGNAYCWGGNTRGELGNGTTTDALTPQLVVFAPDGAVDYTSAQSLSTTSIRISWTSSSTNENGFLVYRYSGAGAQTLVTSCPTSTPDLTSCDDTGLVPGELYWYVVYAWNSGGVIRPPGLAVARTLPATPTAPTVTSATAIGPNSFRVQWIDNSNNETEFRIYRWNGSAPELMGTVAGGTSADVSDPAVSSSTYQVFLVSAANSSGETLGDGYVYSTAFVTPEPTAPVLGTITGATGSGLTINWTDNATNETGYVVYRFTPGNGLGSVVNCPTSTPNLTACADTGLTPGEFYIYYVYPLIPGQAAIAGNPLVYRAPKPLPAPTMSSVVTVRPKGLRVTWVDNATDETGYVVYEYANGTLTPVATVAANVTSKEITGLSAGSVHVYLVAAQRGTEIRYAPQAIWGIAP
jgi:Regulator of chromosome condensation (RCC1) repeat